MLKRLDKELRKLDKQASKAIGLSGVQISHLANPDSEKHKKAVKQFHALLKGEEEDTETSSDTIVAAGAGAPAGVRAEGGAGAAEGVEGEGEDKAPPATVEAAAAPSGSLSTVDTGVPEAALLAAEEVPENQGSNAVTASSLLGGSSTPAGEEDPF